MPRALLSACFPVTLCLLSGCQSALGHDFTQVAGVLERSISEGCFPGCSVAVGTSEKLLWIDGFGRFAYDDDVARKLGLDGNPEPDAETSWDLASLTKVVGTTSVVIALVRDGKLKIDDPVSRWVPELSTAIDAPQERSRRDKITVAHLLAHASGFPAWKPFYRETTDYASTLRAILATPLENAPGDAYRYSDLGFILLGEVAARAGGKPLPRLERELVFAPLGMSSTLRSPARKARSRIPPTERDPANGQFVHGVVHDENSRVSGGVTGHAGLFATARDLSRFATEMLLALRGKSGKFPRKLVRRFTSRAEIIAGSSRALGWDTPSGRSSGGKSISKSAFGHTGFTGTSIWIDPSRDIYFILLTNRVHPTRENRKILQVRRDFADAVLEEIDRKRKTSGECRPPS